MPLVLANGDGDGYVDEDGHDDGDGYDYVGYNDKHQEEDVGDND